MIVRYTLFQQVNPIKHATIVSDQIGVESVDESSHRSAVTTKHDISDAILSANVRQRTLKSLAVMSPLGTVFVQEGAERRVTRWQTVRSIRRSIRRARRRTGTALSNVRPVRRRRRCCTRRRSAKRQLLQAVHLWVRRRQRRTRCSDPSPVDGRSAGCPSQ